MSNTLYPLGREAFAVGALNWLGTLGVAVLDGSYNYDAAHSVMSSVAGADLFRFTPTGATADGGVLDLDDYTEPVVAFGDVIRYLVIYQDNGSDAANNLIMFIDTAADTTPLFIATTGGPVEIIWPNGPNKITRL